MIKVLKKTSDVLALIGREGSLSLKELCAVTGLKKPGLFLILKTLTELGLVRKTTENEYEIGERLCRIVRPSLLKNSLLAIAGRHARDLAEAIREQVVVAAFYRGDRFVIARASVQQSVIVNTDVTRRQRLYETATGRVLLSQVDETQLKTITGTYGLPGDRWKEAATWRKLKRALREVAERGIAFHGSPDGQALSLAVPVHGPEASPPVAMGVAIPASRFMAAHKREVLTGLKSVADRMSDEWLLAGGATFLTTAGASHEVPV